MNKQFDPTKMEAVAMLPAPEGVESGFVMEVIEEIYATRRYYCLQGDSG